MAYRSPHQILNISTNATKLEIKKAYRKLAKKYHPDVNKSPQAQQKFIEVTKAYKAALSGKKVSRIKDIEDEKFKQEVKQRYANYIRRREYIKKQKAESNKAFMKKVQISGWAIIINVVLFVLTMYVTLLSPLAYLLSGVLVAYFGKRVVHKFKPSYDLSKQWFYGFIVSYGVVNILLCINYLISFPINENMYTYDAIEMKYKIGVVKKDKANTSRYISYFNVMHLTTLSQADWSKGRIWFKPRRGIFGIEVLKDIKQSSADYKKSF